MAQYHPKTANFYRMSLSKWRSFQFRNSSCPKLTITSSRSFLSTGTLEFEGSGILAYNFAFYFMTVNYLILSFIQFCRLQGDLSQETRELVVVAEVSFSWLQFFYSWQEKCQTVAYFQLI